VGRPGAADSRTVLASGAAALAEYQRALDEWRLLTASALAGLVEQTMTIAAGFAKTRYTLGVPISTLQAISHPLANMAITIEGGRNLVPAGRLVSRTTNPTSDPNWRRRRSCSWPRRRQGRHHGGAHPGWPRVSAEAAATAYLVRARAGRWPAAIRGQRQTVAHILADRESASQTA
jgi:alkylation response protein AidB-like acyl-CoA dehydrogenase